MQQTSIKLVFVEKSLIITKDSTWEENTHLIENSFTLVGLRPEVDEPGKYHF
jgi:hypothetical protein